MVAPSSMRAWFHAPGSCLATMASATASAVRIPRFRMSSSIAKTRASTRATFPSTSPTGSPNAMLAMAPAV